MSIIRATVTDRYGSTKAADLPVSIAAPLPETQLIIGGSRGSLEPPAVFMTYSDWSPELVMDSYAHDSAPGAEEIFSPDVVAPNRLVIGDYIVRGAKYVAPYWYVVLVGVSAGNRRPYILRSQSGRAGTFESLRVPPGTDAFYGTATSSISVSWGNGKIVIFGDNRHCVCDGDPMDPDAWQEVITSIGANARYGHFSAGKFRFVRAASPYFFVESDDGVTWVNRADDPEYVGLPFFPVAAVIELPSGRLVAGGSGGDASSDIAFSDDGGRTWSLRLTEYRVTWNTHIQRFFYVDGVLYAFANRTGMIYLYRSLDEANSWEYMGRIYVPGGTAQSFQDGSTFTAPAYTYSPTAGYMIVGRAGTSSLAQGQVAWRHPPGAIASSGMPRGEGDSVPGWWREPPLGFVNIAPIGQMFIGGNTSYGCRFWDSIFNDTF